MRVSPAGIVLLHDGEGLKLVGYRDSGGLPTIGWGTTRYPPWHLEGRRVMMGDRCSKDQADQFFRHDLMRTEDAVDALTRDDVLVRHFDALCSLGYNIGTGQQGYAGSTVRRRVNANPTDPSIREAFMRWHFDDGVPVPGLWHRRHKEADFYFGVFTECPPFPHAVAA